VATNRVRIPDFDFSGFYYGEILEALIRFKRQNLPELTDETDFEPTIQLLRAFALVGHLNNVLIDGAANEGMLPTAKLVETVRNMLRLIDYVMSPPTPATVEIVYELSRVFTATSTAIPANAKAGTQRLGNDPAVIFEANEALSLTNTDQCVCFVWEVSSGFLNHTVAANSANPVNDFVVWPDNVEAGNYIAFGHADAMWDKLVITLATAGSGYLGVWEYYDGEWLRDKPDTVTQLGAQLRVELDVLLGGSDRSGATVRVTYNETGAYETATVAWDGSNYVLVGLLGQSVPSTSPDAYSVGSDWVEIVGTDTTSGFTVDGNLSYVLPQTEVLNWRRTSISNVSAYWVRFRLISVSAPTSPQLRQARIDTGKQYVLRATTQGQTYVENPVGSSTGEPDQRFTTARDHFIVGTSVVTVDSEEWTLVDNFLLSQPTDKHYAIELGNNDRATIVFGGGNAGLIPPLGVNNIGITYRAGAETNGNVGPGAVTVDKTGVTWTNKLWNPRQAIGWEEAEGSTDESLERAKIAGPMSLRAKEVALNGDDATFMAINTYRSPDGARPFSRAVCIEGAFGPKTLGLIVVPRGGGQASTDDLTNVAKWFNGDPFADPVLRKRIVANQELSALSYGQRLFDIEATVYSSVRGAVTSQSITNALRTIFHPESRLADGVTWRWAMGEDIPLGRVSHEIFDVSDTITNVLLTTPVATIAVGAFELPYIRNILISIVEPAQ
jgi:hypothetical protein